jgi:hypothetical protein
MSDDRKVGLLGYFGMVVLLGLAGFGGLLGYRAIRPIVAGESSGITCPTPSLQECADRCSDAMVEVFTEELDCRRPGKK